MDESTPTPAANAPQEPGADAPQEPGVVSRMLNVLFSPGEVFQSVNRSVGAMDWLIPLVVSAIVSVIAVQFTMPIILSDSRPALEAQFDKNPNMTQEQREKAVATVAKITTISVTAFAALMVFAIAVVLALLFMAATNFVFGGEATFRKSLAVTSYCGLVAVPSSIVSIPLALSMGTMVVQFGPGLLLPDSLSGTFVYHLLGNLNLFMVWQGALAAIGMGIVSGTGTKRPAIVIFILLAVYVLGIAAFKTATGG
jgi:hypothetical protein